MTNTYTRPAKTPATSVGWNRRSSWSRLLRRQAMDTLPRADLFAAEEETAKTIRARKGQDRAAWTSVRVRFDVAATLSVLQRLHLEATGKEISKAEVLAALMTAGLRTIANHADFGGVRD